MFIQPYLMKSRVEEGNLSPRGDMKTLVQCDFDGTITEEDVSFGLLDAFAQGDWRQLLREYQDGNISVGRFNQEAFAMVKADRQSLLAAARSMVKVRAGFPELVSCCHRKGFRLVVVSNGLDFYIEEILKDAGTPDIEVHAAKTLFRPDGLRVHFVGPDGNHLDDDFKVAHVNSFLGKGYRIAYVGDGSSDLSPAKRCHYVFATGNLLAHCKQANLGCVSFTDFYKVMSVLELW